MNPYVETPLGAIQGNYVNGTNQYLGIPYAKPPVNELRFRAPQPISGWSETLIANQYRRNPMQVNPKWDYSYYSEDCLYLNIWTPAEVGEKRPVMVWIPGGSYETGGAGAVNSEGPAMYEFDAMALDTNCIVVSVSYRLNVFGFLNLSYFDRDFEDNLGMKDIIAALQWVHRYIGAFGGDADNVTLFGHSAGAGAISGLMLCDEAEPYFHKVILQSGCFESFYTPEEEQDVVQHYLQYAGVDVSNVKKLLEFPYEQIYAAAKQLEGYIFKHYFGRCTFCPVVDGKFIKDFPTLATFKNYGKPVLTGTTKNEANLLIPVKEQQGVGERNRAVQFSYQEAIERIFSEKKKIISELCEHYHGLKTMQDCADVLTDVIYGITKLRFAEHFSKEGKVYVYMYDYATPAMKEAQLLVCHGAELLSMLELKVLPYAKLHKGGEETEKKIGMIMRKYWGAFAHTGIPEVTGQTKWEPYDVNRRQTMVFSSEGEYLVPDAEAEARKFYDGIDRILI